MKDEKFKGQTKRIWYQKGIKDGLSKAIEHLGKKEIKYNGLTGELQIYTVNPIIFELKALRGDFEPEAHERLSYER